MNCTKFLLFLGTTFSAGLLLASGTGCGGSGGNGTAGGATTSGTTSAAVTLDCTSYCNEVTTNCTASTVAQYTDVTSCMNVCAGFTAMGTLQDTSGDTLGCRIYHAGAAAGSAANATTHCPHAGPTGGDRDPNGSTGTCGEPCTSFCSIAAKVCTGNNQQFNGDMATCVTACKGFKADAASYDTSDVANNDMGCRFYHLSAAAESATAAMTHCPHIVTNSAVCIM